MTGTAFGIPDTPQDSISGGDGVLNTSPSNFIIPSGWSFARGTITQNGLLAGAFSATSGPDVTWGIGAGRGIAYRTWTNTSNESLTLRVNAVLDGEIQESGGTATAGVYIFDATALTNAVTNSGLAAPQFFLNGSTLTALSTGATSLAALVPGALLNEFQSVTGPANELLSIPLSSGFITVDPQQSITVMFDVSAYAPAFGWSNFASTLAPSPTLPLFADMDGNAVTQLVAAGPSVVPPAPPASLVLTPSTASNQAGATGSVTATVTDASGSPIPNAIVFFAFNSGPNAGPAGPVSTNASGQAVFTYTDAGGAGTDVIQASLGGLTATPVSITWSVYTQTITFGTLLNQPFGTAPFPVSATSTSGLTVSFNSQTPSVCTVSNTTVTLVMGGPCTIQATQSGDIGYSAASPVNQSFQVTALSQTINFAGPLASQPFATAPFSISASASATSGLAVTFGSATPAVCTMWGSTVMLVEVGSCLIQVTQGGDADYAAAPLVEEGFDVTPNPLRFIAMTPCRIADTRYSNGAFGSPSLVGGATRSFTIPGSSCGIPTTAAAYSLNVTVVPPGPLDYITVWPSGAAQPLVSTLNSVDGRIKATAAIIPAGTNGAVSVYATNPTDVILDIDGYFVPAGSDASALAFYPLTPCRIADTRYSSYGSLGPPSLSAGQSRSFDVLSSACNVPSTAQAYSLNFTVVPPGKTPLNYITTYPSGAAQPLASPLNDLTGTIVANAAIVPAGTGGAVSVYTYSATDLVIDINGYFAPPGTGGLSLYNLTPAGCWIRGCPPRRRRRSPERRT